MARDAIGGATELPEPPRCLPLLLWPGRELPGVFPGVERGRVHRFLARNPGGWAGQGSPSVPSIPSVHRDIQGLGLALLATSRLHPGGTFPPAQPFLHLPFERCEAVLPADRWHSRLRT